MKINVLKKLIEKLVKEEVDKQVQRQVNEAMIKIVGKLITETRSAKPQKQVVRESVVAKVTEPTTPQMIAPKTGNEKLDNVLTEMAHHFKPLGQPGEGVNLSSLMGDGFDKVGSVSEEIYASPEPKTNIDFLKSVVSDNTTPRSELQPSVLDTAPDALNGLFKRDFRSLMKKIDEQKKSGGPGLINPSMVVGG